MATPEAETETADSADLAEPAPEPEAPEDTPETDSAPEIAEVQPQLEVGAVNDPLEAEADTMADRVVRREAAASAFETDTEVQAQLQVGADGGAAGPELSAGIDRARGAGASLTPDVQDRMEDSFGVDLSGVRVHTGAASARMNDEIGARAFTHGTDIHFNTGEFSPNSREGTRLLAHEMTHVVQQNAGLRRKPAVRRQVHRKATDDLIQPSRKLFGPAGLTEFPKGTGIHAEILPVFIGKTRGSKKQGPNPNADLLIEPQVPGANSRGLSITRFGAPDFYRNSTAIGLVSNGTGFDAINAGRDKVAPRPPLTAGGSVEDITGAPKRIGLADLKPASLTEELLGVGQLQFYSQGIKNTAKVVNQYQLEKGHSGDWKPDPFIETGLDIPDKLEKPDVSDGVSGGALWVYEYSNTGKSRVHDRVTGFKGSVVVHKSGSPGIYSYEWVPSVIPGSIGNPAVVKLVADLENDVVPLLKSGWEVKKKAKPGVQRPVRRATKKVPPRGLQRKTSDVGAQRPALRRAMVQRAAKPHVPFNDKPYNQAFKAWNEKVDDQKVLGTKAKPGDDIFDTLHEVKKRTDTKIAYPTPDTNKVKETDKAFRKIRHWRKFGHLYVWFRKRFDRVWGKLSKFGQTIKDKVSRLRRTVGSSGFGNWIKAAAKALLKVFKTYAAWAITEISDKLLDSLQEGVTNVGTALMNAALPEGAKSKIEEIKEAGATIDGFINGSVQDLEKKIFGDKIGMMEDLQKIMSFVGPITDIINIVKWGVKIAACAAPPLVGCLWNLAISALEFAFAKILETCWFGKKVFGWMKSNATLPGISTLWKFPNDVATLVVEKANGLFALPGLPEGTKLFADIPPINENSFNQYSGDCGGGGGGSGPEPTIEQRELMRIAEAVGEEKFNAFLEMMSKRGAGPTVQLTLERIHALKMEEVIKGLTAQQMLDIANGAKVETTVPIEEFLKSIKTHTPAEQERIAKRDIDYEKARRNNPIYEGRLKWDAKKFVEEDRNISVDSKEFADAVHDAQEVLGMKKPDGMMGPNTVKEYYEKNRQPRDEAYKNAVAELAGPPVTIGTPIELTKAQEAEIAKKRKEPYPSAAQLQSDLKSVTFPLSPAHASAPDAVFWRIDYKKNLIYGWTSGGKRYGVHYKTLELDIDGTVHTTIVGTGDFYAVDPIVKGDRICAVFGGMSGADIAMFIVCPEISTNVPAGGRFTAGRIFEMITI